LNTSERKRKMRRVTLKKELSVQRSAVLAIDKQIAKQKYLLTVTRNKLEHLEGMHEVMIGVRHSLEVRIAKGQVYSTRGPS